MLDYIDSLVISSHPSMNACVQLHTSAVNYTCYADAMHRHLSCMPVWDEFDDQKERRFLVFYKVQVFFLPSRLRVSPSDMTHEGSHTKAAVTNLLPAARRQPYTTLCLLRSHEQFRDTTYTTEQKPSAQLSPRTPRSSLNGFEHCYRSQITRTTCVGWQTMCGSSSRSTCSSVWSALVTQSAS